MSEVVGGCIHGLNLVSCHICNALMGIHERLITRLGELRALQQDCQPRNWTGHVHIEGEAEAQRQKLNTGAFLEALLNSPVIDMAIDNVRRKCPNCGDRGEVEVLDAPLEPVRTIKSKCYCNRPALLAEWERRLNGEKEPK